MERNHLEQLLRANNLPHDASDEEMIAMLREASYTEEEAIRAVTTLRHAGHTEQAIVQNGNSKLFRSGERLNAGEISQLLGIDVTVNETIITEPQKAQLSLSELVTVWLLSAIIAATAVVGYMYIHDMGMFHPMMVYGKE